MTRRDETNLDRSIEEIRNETLDADAMRAATERVRQRLAAASAPEPAVDDTVLDGCPGYQAVFPAYLRGEVSASRVLLLEDHVRECAACRKALREARSPQPVSVRPVETATPGSWARTAWWATAAVLVIGAGLAAYGLRDRLMAPAFAATGRIESIDGSLFRVGAGAMRPVAVGETIARGESIRADRDSGAVVRLADGSQVEMRERSELSLAREGDGVAVDLAMGSVIVQAAPQGRGHLYVRSDDCLVAVRGTIFTVSHGLKGSRVSVVEGLVEVRFGDEAFRILEPGQQVATSESLEKTSVESEVAWSRDVDRYVALLGELRALQKTMDAEVPRPGLRTSTRLLDLAPQGTVFYAAIPNVSASLVEARRVLKEKVAASPVLQEWWSRKVAPLGGEAAVDEALDRLRAVGDHLGDEIVITFQKHAGGEVQSPLVLAEVRNPDALRAALAAEIDRVGRENGTHSFARLLDEAEVFGPAAVRRKSDTMLFWVRDDLLAASPDLDAIRTVVAASAASPQELVRSSFHDRLSDAYRDGAGWLLGLDLHAILEGAGTDRARLEPTGVLDAEHLIVEATEEEGQLRDAAVLTFDQPRRGVASWLASPGPMGSLRFISPDASLAAGFVVKDPVAMVEDAHALLRASNPDFDRHLDELTSKTGIDMTRDLAAPLGGEIAFALDGPVLPVPAWKLVVEVHDASRLADTIDRLVARANASIRDEGFGGLTVAREQIGDRTFFTLRSERPKLEVHYLFTDGYLVAAPQRVLLERAMQQRESGYDLASSPKFAALLPRDARTSFSAIAYQDLGSLVGPLARGIAGSAEGLTPEQQKTLAEYSAGSPAGLAYAYAERDRIVFGGGRSGGIVSLLGSLLGLDHPQALQQVVGELSRRSAPDAEGRTAP